jgi:4-hydroxy-2-oxoglutarate aldolase
VATIDLKGIFPPIPTPFVNGKIAYKKLESNIEKWSKTGLKGFVVLDPTGSMYTYQIKKKEMWLRLLFNPHLPIR